MKKKIVSLILASAMVVTTLAGCGSSGAQESSSAPAAAESESQAESEAPKEEAEAPADENLSEIEKEIGPVLIAKRPPLFYDYLRYRLYEVTTVLDSMKDNKSEKKDHFVYLKNEYEKLLEEEQNG